MNEYAIRNMSTQRNAGIFEAVTLEDAIAAFALDAGGRTLDEKVSKDKREADFTFESKDGSRLHKLFIFEMPF